MRGNQKQEFIARAQVWKTVLRLARAAGPLKNFTVPSQKELKPLLAVFRGLK